MSGLNLLVFREDQRHASGQQLREELAGKLEQATGCYSHEALLAALLPAGELECGTADAGPHSAHSAEIFTDSIADALVAGASASDFQGLSNTARHISVPDQLHISTPEGFAYYALHPLAYADVCNRICESANHLFVIGIRSIGTTLSAVVAASARARAIDVKRITVRPQGHPYNRHTEFLAQQLADIQNAIASEAVFAIVDEGPGLSGSSFLSVAEALERQGVPREKITLVSSHTPDVDALCADGAAGRWKRYRNIAVAAESRRPNLAETFIGGGQWRNRLLADESAWPASWVNFERLKYLGSTEQAEPRLYKFAGLGHYGEKVFERELKVAKAGFGLLPRRESDGFISYPWMDGRPLSCGDLSPQVLKRLAEYCAFRLRAFPVELADLNAVQQMAEHNLRELGLDIPVELRLKHPVIADGRMQPHEWLLTKEGQLLKTDSGSHGDDHFFPGPTDIAWDLAGAIVEWRMNEEQAKALLDHYCHASGDDASERIDGFIKAYTVFRLSYCLMAANAMAGPDEQPRLQRAADDYRTLLTQIKTHSLAAASSLT